VEKVHGEDALQQRVYKHALERNGVRTAIHAVKRMEHVFGSVWCLKP